MEYAVHVVGINWEPDQGILVTQSQEKEENSQR